VDQQVRPILVFAAVVGMIAVLGGMFYLRSIGVGVPAAAAPPGVSQMKQLQQSGAPLTPPRPAVYVPTGAPSGVKAMISQSRSGVPPTPPPAVQYVPPGAPSGVKQMIQQSPSGSPGMAPGGMYPAPR